MRRLSVWCRIYLALVAFSILGLALTSFAGLSPGPIAHIASASTLLFGVATLFHTVLRSTGLGKAVLVFVLVLGLGTAVEICGLYQGLPFGKYEYTDKWVPVLALPGGHFFPVLLPFAWMLVAGSTALLFNRNRWTPILFVALITTAIDFAMEYVMTERLGYWKWVDKGPLPGDAPWSNSAGWYATSWLATGIIYSLVPKKTPTREPGIVLVAYAVLMLAIAILHSPRA